MKCIAYVSKVVTTQSGVAIPMGLSRILSSARKNNAKHAITGVMSYRNGRYIQFFEGENSAVDQLYLNIELDSRHKRVIKLFDFEIEQRSFLGWDMKLSQSLNKDPKFLKFIARNSHFVKNLDSNLKELLEPFYSFDGAKFSNPESYEGKSLRLSAWPDFTSIQPTPAVIELCARLTKRAFPYNLLVSGGEFGTKDQVDKILALFDDVEILLVTDGASANDTQLVEKKSNSRFYLKMRGLLGLK